MKKVFYKFLLLFIVSFFVSCNFAGNSEGGNGTGSNTPAGDETPPADVTDLKIFCTASQTVNLKWTNPADADFEKVVIYYNDNQSKTVKSLGKEITITNLTNDREYEFKVVAYDKSANESNGVSIKAVPHVPGVIDLPAGTKPSDVEGEAYPIPLIEKQLLDYLYLAEICAGTTAELIINTNLALDGNRHNKLNQWYVGKEGGNWEKVAANEYLRFSVQSGITYYMYEGTIIDKNNENGNTVFYSNVLRIECGTEKTKNIGKIVYSDGTFSEDYDSSKTPVGVIFDINEDGSPKAIINLKESENPLKWYNGYFNGGIINTSDTDGSNNWKIVSDACAKNVSKFEAFRYCAGLKDNNKEWYLPSIKEMTNICYNIKAMNTAMSKLPEGMYTEFSYEDKPSINRYWSSTQSVISKYSSSAWLQCFDKQSGYAFNMTSMEREYKVRPVAKF